MSLSIWATPYVKAHPNRAPGMRLSVTSWTGCPFCGPVSPFPSHPAVCSVGPCKMWPLWQEWKLCTGSTTWTSPLYDSVTPVAVPTVTAGHLTCWTAETWSGIIPQGTSQPPVTYCTELFPLWKNNFWNSIATCKTTKNSDPLERKV